MWVLRVLRRFDIIGAIVLVCTHPKVLKSDVKMKNRWMECTRFFTGCSIASRGRYISHTLNGRPIGFIFVVLSVSPFVCVAVCLSRFVVSSICLGRQGDFEINRHDEPIHRTHV